MTELFELMGKISIVGADEAEMTVNRVIDNVRASGEKINGMLSALGKDVTFNSDIIGSTAVKMPEINIPESAEKYAPDINTDIPLESVVSAIKDKINGIEKNVSDISLPPIFVSETGSISNINNTESDNTVNDNANSKSDSSVSFLSELGERISEYIGSLKKNDIKVGNDDTYTDNAKSESFFRQLSETLGSISAEKNSTFGSKNGQSVQNISVKGETLKDPFDILSEGLPDSAKRTEELINEMLAKMTDSSREKISSEGLDKLLSDDVGKAAASISHGMDKTGTVLDKALDRIGKNSKSHWNSIASSANGVGAKMAESVSSGISNVESACRNVADRAAAALSISGEGAGSYLIDTMNQGINAKAWELYETASRVASNISSIMSSVTMSVNAISGSSKLTGHAKGGVVTREHIARVGEEGAEAIVPLENNTEWIDRVAERINVSGNDERVISKLDELNRNISGMKIYLDGNVLVGSITPQIDRKLGSIARQKRRAFI